MKRLVCQFSCGAASAVAAKLTLQAYGKTHDVQVLNAYIEEEHPDNRRFLSDCETWFSAPITVLQDEKYGASVHECILRSGVMLTVSGYAPCSAKLKRELLASWARPDDIMILGYTKGEEDRFDRYLDANNNVDCMAPLIERGLTKADCLAMLQQVGIELPAMYRLGYNNANCIGCVKGGEGYWNKIRVDFPEQFERMAALEELVGAKSFRNRKTGVRYGLRDLPPTAGRRQKMPDISCSFFCEMNLDVMRATDRETRR